MTGAPLADESRKEAAEGDETSSRVDEVSSFRGLIAPCAVKTAMGVGGTSLALALPERRQRRTANN
jgi:hypothetical protein